MVGEVAWLGGVNVSGGERHSKLKLHTHNQVINQSTPVWPITCHSSEIALAAMFQLHRLSNYESTS